MQSAVQSVHHTCVTLHRYWSSPVSSISSILISSAQVRPGPARDPQPLGPAPGADKNHNINYCPHILAITDKSRPYTVTFLRTLSCLLDSYGAYPAIRNNFKQFSEYFIIHWIVSTELQVVSLSEHSQEYLWWHINFSQFIFSLIIEFYSNDCRAVAVEDI